MDSEKTLDVEFIINSIKHFYTWVDNIKSHKKRVHSYPENKTRTVDVIELYFNYDNIEFIKRGKSIKELKNTFYDFLGRYFNNDPRKSGSTIDIEFYEIKPTRI